VAHVLLKILAIVVDLKINMRDFEMKILKVESIKIQKQKIVENLLKKKLKELRTHIVLIEINIGNIKKKKKRIHLSQEF
jgi:hypothetical protein